MKQFQTYYIPQFINEDPPECTFIIQGFRLTAIEDSYNEQNSMVQFINEDQRECTFIILGFRHAAKEDSYNEQHSMVGKSHLNNADMRQFQTYYIPQFINEDPFFHSSINE